MFHRPLLHTHRFFFALIPPIVLARRIANAAHWFEAEGTPVSADRLHVTMFILEDRFDAPDEVIAGLKEVGQSIAMAPFEMTLDYINGGGRSIALRPQHKNAALDALRKQITKRCAEAGISDRPGYAFSPHVTLGYRDGRPFGERIAALNWIADELVLIHSHLGKTRHEPLGRWPLIAPPEPQLSLF